MHARYSLTVYYDRLAAPVGLRRIEPPLTEIVRIMHLQPRAKKTDHSNWGRPTLTRFRLPTVCNNVVRGMPRYLW
jgi:hypothetical protein